MVDNIRLTTPKGYAQYPYLLEPDTKFNPEGDYKVNLAMEDDETTKKLIDKLTSILEEFYAEDGEVAKAIAKGRKVTLADIYDVDEEGRIILKFKQRAKITSKIGKKIDVKIPQFDSHGKPLADGAGVNIGRDSVIKVNFSVVPYYMPTTKTCGLTLRPVAVQIIKLNEFTGATSAEYCGFSDEGEGGFEATNNTDDDDNEENFNSNNSDF